MEDQRHADFSAKMLRIGGDRTQGLRADGEQEIVDHRLVRVGDPCDRRRQGEHHVVVLDRQQVGLSRLQPIARGASLALRAMPIAT
jgi:hypothetical protein